MTEPRKLDLDPRSAVPGIAKRLGLPIAAVSGTVELLLDGNTVPFIARYRKERTGGLDDAQIRAVEQALELARALLARKDTVLRSIAEQGQLNPALEQRILAAPDLRELEDLYLPFRPKRRTRAGAARERGLEPLAAILREQRTPPGSVEQILRPFILPDRGVPDADAALAGAADILAEEWAEHPDSRAWLRRVMAAGVAVSRKKRGYAGNDDRFESYYDFREPLARLAPHRFLALRRGAAEGALSLAIETDDERLVGEFSHRLVRNPTFVFRDVLQGAARDSYQRLLRPAIETETLAALGERGDADAIAVFARNLGQLLLAAAAGPRAVMGIDPGFRTGCKIAVIDKTGRVLDHATIHPTAPRNDTEAAAATLRELITRHQVELIAIGNGTASRETDVFVTAALGPGRSTVQKVLVSEAGASVYSASEIARAELPELDVTLRGAVSIARRLQDPLAELVKIEPRSIGVGQYQHDLDSGQLDRALDAVVESAVNRVGVELNTASPALLSRVAGIGPRLAAALVKYRDEHGPFPNRESLHEVPRFGNKAFEQSAGFLRIRGGDNALDGSAVHPENYSLVAQMARDLGMTTGALIGHPEAVARITPHAYLSPDIGMPTITDICAELLRPGRDPRPAFRVVHFSEMVTKLEDLRPGQRLEGVVTNVTGFGAFVDIGVHQDGLIHISELDSRRVTDPGSVVKVGDIFEVVVLEVDTRRRRVGLSRKRALESQPIPAHNQISRN